MNRIAGYIIVFKLLFCACSSQEMASGFPKVRPVQTQIASSLENIQHKYPGIVEAGEQSNLAFRLSGKIIQLDVHSGRQVAKGDTIARLLDRDYRLQFETARKNYNTTREIYERNQRLLTANAIATQEVEIAKTNYLQASEALRIAKDKLQQTVLKAPFAGFIEQKKVELFDEIQAGESIVRLVSPTDLEIHFTLPENAFQHVLTPGNIQIEFDRITGKRFTAKIKEYIHVSDGTGIPVVLKITDKDFAQYRDLILPGFACQVIWEPENRFTDYFLIPASAILKQGKKEFLWLVNPHTSTVYLQEIKTFVINSQIYAKSGLKTEDIVVTAGVRLLKEGQKVRTNLKRT